MLLFDGYRNCHYATYDDAHLIQIGCNMVFAALKWASNSKLASPLLRTYLFYSVKSIRTHYMARCVGLTIMGLLRMDCNQPWDSVIESCHHAPED